MGLFRDTNFSLLSYLYFGKSTTTKNAKEIDYFTWKKSVFQIFKTDVFLSDIENKCKRHRFLTDVKQEKRHRFYLKPI